MNEEQVPPDVELAQKLARVCEGEEIKMVFMANQRLIGRTIAIMHPLLRAEAIRLLSELVINLCEQYSTQEHPEVNSNQLQ